MTEKDWGRFDRWHLLFDALCKERGHYDNAALASELCGRNGRRGEKDHEAAEKNLRNWRLGKRLPLRRNVVALAQLLDIAADPDLAARWDGLHREARADFRADTAGDPGEATSLKPFRRLPAFGRTAIVASVLGAGLVIGGVVKGDVDERPQLVGVSDFPTVAYNARVVMSVGASKLVNGASGGCEGAPPPDWQRMRDRVPESATGVFEDGGLATQMINRCGRELIVRAVRFTALRPGIEELKLLSGYIRIEVTEPPAPPG